MHTFYGFNSKLSNFNIAPMTIDGQKFNCVEQYFQYKKAEYHKDTVAMDAILKTWRPSLQKKLGSTVRNFDGKGWGKESYSVMKKALKAKFSQNPTSREALKSTGNEEIVEASPYDSYWGAGVSAENLQKGEPVKGRNVMGKLLQEIRDEL